MEILQANKTVSVLGCGWLGFEVARLLVAGGTTVRGSTTSPEKQALLQQAGIEPFVLNLATETPIHARFVQATSLLISVPPKALNGSYTLFLNQLDRLVSELELTGPEQVIFISSTGVYPENAGEVTEEMAAPHSERAAALLRAEEIIRTLSGNRTTVLRLGGLFGPGRHPGRFLAGKTALPGGSAPINFIHQADAAALIIHLINRKITGETFHACADEHPTRAEFYTRAAALAELAAPEFAPAQAGNFSRINSTKIKQALGYRFLFPDPLAALDSLAVPGFTS